jgi:hypothetical protein
VHSIEGTELGLRLAGMIRGRPLSPKVIFKVMNRIFRNMLFGRIAGALADQGLQRTRLFAMPLLHGKYSPKAWEIGAFAD